MVDVSQLLQTEEHRYEQFNGETKVTVLPEELDCRHLAHRWRTTGMIEEGSLTQDVESHESRMMSITAAKDLRWSCHGVSTRQHLRHVTLNSLG